MCIPVGMIYHEGRAVNHPGMVDIGDKGGTEFRLNEAPTI